VPSQQARVAPLQGDPAGMQVCGGVVQRPSEQVWPSVQQASPQTVPPLSQVQVRVARSQVWPAGQPGLQRLRCLLPLPDAIAAGAAMATSAATAVRREVAAPSARAAWSKRESSIEGPFLVPGRRGRGAGPGRCRGPVSGGAVKAS